MKAHLGFRLRMVIRRGERGEPLGHRYPRAGSSCLVFVSPTPSTGPSTEQASVSASVRRGFDPELLSPNPQAASSAQLSSLAYLIWFHWHMPPASANPTTPSPRALLTFISVPEISGCLFSPTPLSPAVPTLHCQGLRVAYFPLPVTGVQAL